MICLNIIGLSAFIFVDEHIPTHAVMLCTVDIAHGCTFGGDLCVFWVINRATKSGLMPVIECLDWITRYSI